MELSIGITAGGKGSRFGGDKRLALYGGRTFLDHAVSTFSGYEDVIVSFGSKDAAVSCDARVVYDRNADVGPIEAICRILEVAKSGYCFIFPVDMPLVSPRLCEFLSSYISDGIDAICPVVEGRVYPLCAIYAKTVLPVAERQRQNGVYRLMSLLDAVKTKYVDMSMSCFSSDVFRNVNTIKDYQKLQRPVTFAVSGYKKSGKTTLCAMLMDRFAKDGYKVAYLKHDGHDYEMDHEGTDSHRLFCAGADVAIFSSAKASVNLHGERSLEAMLGMFRDYDIVMVEGAKASALEKIQIQRDGEEPFENVFLTLQGEYDADDVYDRLCCHFALS